MSAPDRSLRRGTSTAVQPLFGLLLAVAIGIVVATSVSPAAQAGPPPSHKGGWLETSPTSGRAGDAFKATYWYVAGGTCQFDSVRFEWDGETVATSPVNRITCVATHRFANAPLPDDVGSHVVSAIACYIDQGSGGLHCAATAFATYVIVPTATPTPPPTSTPAPTATPATPAPTATPAGTAKATARPTATAAATAKPTATSPDDAPAEPTAILPTAIPSGEPTPIVDPSGSPNSSTEPTEPSGQPGESGAPTPSPTGGVAAETSPPETPAPSQALVVPVASPPANRYVPALVNYIGGPDAGPIDAAVVATNLLLTVLVVFFFMLTSEIFNSTMDANRDVVHGWWSRLLSGPLAFLGALTVTGAGLDRLSGSSRIGSIMRVLTVLALLGLIYGFLSPDFGLNPQSLVLFISLVIGLGFITYFSEGSSSRLAKSRYRASATIKLYGTAVLVAILAVIVSRSIDLQPGLMYGFIASAVIMAPIALAKRDDATLVLVPAFGLLVVSLAAWLLLGPVRVAAADGAPAPALVETILAIIVIGGLEGLFITLIPLRFLDGATVMRWSRIAWAVVFSTVTFLWWQLLLNQDAAYSAAFEQTNVRIVLFTLVAFMVTTGGLWGYFRFRSSTPDAAA